MPARRPKTLAPVAPPNPHPHLHPTPRRPPHSAAFARPPRTHPPHRPRTVDRTHAPDLHQHALPRQRVEARPGPRNAQGHDAESDRPPEAENSRHQAVRPPSSRLALSTLSLSTTESCRRRKCASITAQLAALQAQTAEAANARPPPKSHHRLDPSPAEAAATAAQEALDIFAKLRARAADTVVS